MNAAGFMSLSKMKSLLAISLLSLFWLLAWAYLALYAASFYSSAFGYSRITASFYQCLHVNLFRSVLYLVFFYGQLLVFKAVAGGQSGLVDYFKIPFSFGSIKTCIIQLNGLKNQTAQINLKLIIKNLIWISYWYIVSDIIFWLTASHFLGDCDDGGLECTCNNLPYLLPVFLTTLLIGCLFVTVTNHMKNNALIKA